MRRFSIKATISCNQCGIAKPLCFSGLGESHADYFKKALASGMLPDWHCEHCGKKHDHQVISCESTEDGRSGA